MEEHITPPEEPQEKTSCTIDDMSELTPEQRCIKRIHCLLDLYRNDDYCYDKLIHYLNMSEKYILVQKQEQLRRAVRKEKLDACKHEFVNDFFTQNDYYYMPEYDIYFSYDKKNYTPISEDIIWSTILTEINKQGKIVAWKDKVRIEIFARIKRRLLTKSIPESDTIQDILTMFTSVICNEKEEAKFLLTIIGDVLLKKSIKHTYIVNSKINEFLTTLEYELNKYTKCYLLNAFKYKYYNHPYNNVLLVKTHTNVDKPFLWKYIIQQHLYDLIVVATHYSRRYDNAYNYIVNRCHNKQVKASICFLHDNTKSSIVESFATNHVLSSSTLSLTKQETLYVWKNYLKKLDVPNIMFQREFHELFQTYYVFNEIEQKYVGVTSEAVNYVKHFREFITTECDVVEHDETAGGFVSYEVSELVQLFQLWSSTKGYKCSINEDQLISLLNHFYEEIPVVNNKYICKFVCRLWNKEKDIDEFMTYHMTEGTDTNEIVTNNDLYKSYCKYYYNKGSPYIVSKSYFEKYLSTV